jgi:peptidyl-tRNA hydrolase, PTH1 family
MTMQITFFETKKPSVSPNQAGIMARMLKLVVGLGNPGPTYEATRHNAGFWFVDALARAWGGHLSLDKGHLGEVARVTVGGQQVWLLKPQTFMNHSGRSVASLARFFKIQPAEILVAYDELDLPPGDARLKFGSNRGTHNGLRDIHDQLGTGQYWRLKLGIGHPGNKAEVANWVLKKPPLDQKIAIEQAIDRALAVKDQLLAGDMAAAMLGIHTSKPQRPKPPRREPVGQEPSPQGT